MERKEVQVFLELPVLQASRDPGDNLVLMVALDHSDLKE